MGNMQQVSHWLKKRTMLLIDVLCISPLSAYLLMPCRIFNISNICVRKADRNKYGSNGFIQPELIFSNHIVWQFLYTQDHFIVSFVNYLWKRYFLHKQVWNPSIQISISILLTNTCTRFYPEALPQKAHVKM